MFRVCQKNSQVFRNGNIHRHLKNASRLSSTIKVTDSKVLGIRREDLNVWERRAPIAPQHVKELTDQGMFMLLTLWSFYECQFNFHCNLHASLFNTHNTQKELNNFS